MALDNPTLPTTIPLGTVRPLFTLTANMNTTADQLFTQVFPFTIFIISAIYVTSPSTSLTTAAGGIYTTASKGGTPIVAAVQVYSGLTSAAKVLQTTLANTDELTSVVPILSLTIAQGGAATANFQIMGFVLA